MAISFLLALAAAPAVPTSSVQVTEDGGAYVVRNLIDNSPLYTFDQDEPGKSNCDEECAATWRPLRTSENETPIGRWTQVKRADGSLQWAYRGKPLYRWVKDQKPGDRTGDGVNGVWHVVKEE